VRFRGCKYAQNAFFGRGSPRTALGQLTSLTQTSSWWEGARCPLTFGPQHSGDFARPGAVPAPDFPA